MKTLRFLNLMLIILLTVTLTIGLTGATASAHERRDVGKYLVVVGWLGEPAFEGQKNGVDLRVTSNVSGETKPVEGLEKTMQVEITHVSTGVSKVIALRTIFRDPGHYTADLIPTASGVYRMRFFGTIEGTPVNETFNSRGGGGNFNDMESSAELQFPTKVAEVREIEAVARHLEEENHELEEGITKANTMAIAGIALGALGTVAGVVSLIASRRKAK
ncbi:MAG: hypothetical protein HYX80_03185 [Chloroflexi bacterium]|nr:hypothetical protein [Chloroflexota bacterium]